MHVHVRLVYHVLSGMTEIGAGTMSSPVNPDSHKIGSVGKCLIGTEIRLDKVDPKTGEGEVSFLFKSTFILPRTDQHVW